jgi:hypothetical protein
MARAAASRRLIPAPDARFGTVTLELASSADDPGLRRLLRENAIGGEIRLTFEREPDFFRAAAMEGTPRQTVIARDARDGRIVGMGSRAVLDVFVNGAPARVGYLSQLRLAEPYRGRVRLLAGGYELLRAAREPGEAPFDLTTIVADNAAARRVLGAGLRNLPAYRELEPFVTLVLPVGRALEVKAPAGVRIERGRPDRSEEIAACLDRERRRHQFAPRWTASDLLSSGRCPGLRPEDFFLAVEGRDVVGCLALWDQSGFKQTVVRGYGPRLTRWRPWINRLARLVRTPALPDPGAPLHYPYLSHVAVSPDRPEVLLALAAAAHDEAGSRGVPAIIAGFAARDPMLRRFARRFRARRFVSLLYAVHWEGGRRSVDALDGRIPHLEVALL